MLPVLTYTAPDAAADALRWRHSTLARGRASGPPSSGCAGAAFPWRTITGEECSGYWPAGTAAFHVNADIADAVIRYVDATGDEEFERGVGLELLVADRAAVALARATTTPTGRFRIDGVTGPDEYSAIADNNVYTNLMAAAEPARRPPTRRERHPRPGRASSASTTEEIGRLARRRRRHVHPLRRGARRAPAVGGLHRAPGAGTSPPPRRTQYPLLLHFPYFDLYRKQVVKQADLVLAMHLCGGRVHRRAEGPQLRLLRGAHRPGLVAVGVHARR